MTRARNFSDTRNLYFYRSQAKDEGIFKFKKMVIKLVDKPGK